MIAQTKSIETVKLTENGLNIQLKGLGKVNYFVGPNGSGKTRLLEQLQSTEAGKLAFIEDDWGRMDDRLVDQDVSKLNEDLKEIGQHGFELIDQEITVRTKLGEKTVDGETEISKVCVHGIDKNVVPGQSILSRGTVKYLTLKKVVSDKMAKNTSNTIGSDGDDVEPQILCFDEIESGLHPDLQRKIPEILEEIVNKHSSSQIFVTTHSPFIISGVRNTNPNHKIYLLCDGGLIDIKMKKDTLAAQIGYGPHQALLASHFMLGSNVQDFVPSPLVLCENSVEVFLQACAKKSNKYFNAYAITVSGDSNAVTNSNAAADLLKAIDNMNKTKPLKYLLGARIAIVFDGPLQNSDKLKLNNSDNVSIHCLGGGEELEQLYDICKTNDYLTGLDYPEWNKAIHSKFLEYLRENGIIDHGDVGKFKEDLAAHIGGAVTCLEEEYPAVARLFDELNDIKKE